jgi:hypothetical protein
MKLSPRSRPRRQWSRPQTTKRPAEQVYGNLNISPAIAVFGDAETANSQGNFNRADADVTPSNSVTQSQPAAQKQFLARDGGSCCTPAYGSPSTGYATNENHCCDGQSQTGEQKVSFADQTVGKQKNDADVTQKQGNGNAATPATRSARAPGRRGSAAPGPRTTRARERGKRTGRSVE